MIVIISVAVFVAAVFGYVSGFVMGYDICRMKIRRIMQEIMWSKIQEDLRKEGADG